MNTEDLFVPIVGVTMVVVVLCTIKFWGDIKGRDAMLEAWKQAVAILKTVKGITFVGVFKAMCTFIALRTGKTYQDTHEGGHGGWWAFVGGNPLYDYWTMFGRTLELRSEGFGYDEAFFVLGRQVWGGEQSWLNEPELPFGGDTDGDIQF